MSPLEGACAVNPNALTGARGIRDAVMAKALRPISVDRPCRPAMPRFTEELVFCASDFSLGKPNSYAVTKIEENKENKAKNYVYDLFVYSAFDRLIAHGFD